jgi:predicted phage terminase large subunit-like protein
MSVYVPTEIRTLARQLRVKQERELADGVVTSSVTDSFGAWLAEKRPEFRWDYRHFLAMQQVLDDVTRGVTRRAYFSLPIRHGKSEHNTISYAAYRLEKNPKFKWLIGSYNQRQANKFSREIRRLVRACGVPLSSERDAAEEWETEAGGGVRAIGAGGGTASVNADGILIDDPIGSRKQAESVAERDELWDWFTNDMLGRAQAHTFVLFTMSRWHSGDPAGRILEHQPGRWRILDLPGRALASDPKTGYHDPLGRAVDEPLWPEVYDDAWMAEKEAELLPYGFASLIQGRPRPREGGMFKWNDWKLMDIVPANGPMIRYWDLAGTSKKSKSHDPDYTAGVLMMRHREHERVIVDVARFRKDVSARDAAIIEVAKADVAQYRAKGRQVIWWLETEAGIAGKDRTTSLKQRIQSCGMPVYDEHPTGDKVIRAEPMASKVGAGNVSLGPGEWRNELRNEAADFPNGNHDDQIDALSGADAKLSHRSGQSGIGEFAVGG